MVGGKPVCYLHSVVNLSLVSPRTNPFSSSSRGFEPGASVFKSPALTTEPRCLPWGLEILRGALNRGQELKIWAQFIIYNLLSIGSTNLDQEQAVYANPGIVREVVTGRVIIVLLVAAHSWAQRSILSLWQLIRVNKGSCSSEKGFWGSHAGMHDFCASLRTA